MHLRVTGFYGRGHNTCIPKCFRKYKSTMHHGNTPHCSLLILPYPVSLQDMSGWSLILPSSHISVRKCSCIQYSKESGTWNNRLERTWVSDKVLGGRSLSKTHLSLLVFTATGSFPFCCCSLDCNWPPFLILWENMSKRKSQLGISAWKMEVLLDYTSKKHNIQW